MGLTLLTLSEPITPATIPFFNQVHSLRYRGVVRASTYIFLGVTSQLLDLIGEILNGN